MPGLTFVCEPKGGLRRESLRLDHAMESLLHGEGYRRHEWLSDDFHYLGYSAYGEYPIHSCDLGHVVIYFEGRLYGRDSTATANSLRELVDLAFNANGGSQRKVTQWLRNADGDFVAILFHKQTNAFFIINDIYGRLPLYYCHTPHRFILTRELRFIANFIDCKKFDRMALAQHLLVGYPLGERTLLEDVHRLSPATSITIQKKGFGIKIDHHDQFNCELRTDERRTVKENAARLVDLFARSCTARVATDANVVLSLSGGFDSRAIAACFHKSGMPFHCVTFLDPSRRAEADVAIARQVANLFGAEWKLVRLNPPLASDVLKLLRIKNGMNPLYMSFLLAFLDQVRKSWGPDLVFLSGEIGDRLLPDRRPAGDLAGIGELVDHLISQDPKFSLETVVALTGIKRTDILDEMRHHISSYPEQDWTKKYIHFVTYERIFKWLTEGEDRNRCYFWSATPYSAFEFFDFAIRCPDEQKSYYGLYREFLLQLSPTAAAIEHAGTGEAVMSDRFTTVRKTLKFLQADPALRRRLQMVMGPPQGYEVDPMTIACLREQIAHSEAIFEYLSESAVRNIVEHYTNYTKESIDLLFTITAPIEERLTGKSILESFDSIAGASN
jgi:asparagine synthase (glutamine-hydrolysing)